MRSIEQREGAFRAREIRGTCRRSGPVVRTEERMHLPVVRGLRIDGRSGIRKVRIQIRVRRQDDLRARIGRAILFVGAEFRVSAFTIVEEDPRNAERGGAEEHPHG